MSCSFFSIHPLSVRCLNAYSGFSRMARENHATHRQSSWRLIQLRFIDSHHLKQAVRPLTGPVSWPGSNQVKVVVAWEPLIVFPLSHRGQIQESGIFLQLKHISEVFTFTSGKTLQMCGTQSVPLHPWASDGEYNFSGLSATMECGSISQPNGDVGDASPATPVVPSFHTPGMVPPLCPVVLSTLINRLDPTIAELVVFLRGLWLEGSVKTKWGRGSVHLEGARAEGMGAPDEGGAGED
ncbi:hypothetical protein BKA83DRAFT_4576940 [Pisolithus microcarpus]|nr:hypothetical protein BKA83DRAFT_4576940 [Pisolithus microcarpus]